MKKLQKLNGKKLSKKEQQTINGGYIDPECNDFEIDICIQSGRCWQGAPNPSLCGHCVDCPQ